MKRIPLTREKFAVVDNALYDELNQHKWHAQWNESTQSFYARRSTCKKGKKGKISMSREILRLNEGDKRQPDHKDHNTLDNRISNLRIVTPQQNHFNRKNPKGYYWNKVSQKFHAQITLNDKHIHLGLFLTAKKAHDAYLKAKEIYHK